MLQLTTEQAAFLVQLAQEGLAAKQRELRLLIEQLNAQVTQEGGDD
jgi:hypothetical protein